MRQSLYKRNAGSKHDYLDAEERDLDMEHGLVAQQSRLSEAQAEAVA